MIPLLKHGIGKSGFEMNPTGAKQVPQPSPVTFENGGKGPGKNLRRPFVRPGSGTASDYCATCPDLDRTRDFLGNKR